MMNICFATSLVMNSLVFIFVCTSLALYTDKVNVISYVYVMERHTSKPSQSRNMYGCLCMPFRWLEGSENVKFTE